MMNKHLFIRDAAKTFEYGTDDIYMYLKNNCNLKLTWRKIIYFFVLGCIRYYIITLVLIATVAVICCDSIATFLKNVSNENLYYKLLLNETDLTCSSMATTQ